MRRTFSMLAAFVVAALTANFVAAQDVPHGMKGTVLKYSQPIGHLTPNGTDMHTWGEDIPSDVDWMKIMESPTLPPNWVIADDFRDPFDTPVMTVRWWGSYVGPTFQENPGAPPTTLFGPGSEDGYVISFFKDIPVGPDNEFSRPGELLGSYVLPLEKVWIEPTPFIGWPDPNLNTQQLQIWEYKANLMDAHLDHPSDLADQMGFHQRPGEVYWISIMAEVGHRIKKDVDPASGEEIWVVEPSGKFTEQNTLNPEGHFWGWHTSPERFNDVATMGHLFMPGNEWIYEGWNPIDPRHELLDMAFELYTIPEPSSIVLIGFAAIGICCFRSRSSRG